MININITKEQCDKNKKQTSKMIPNMKFQKNIPSDKNTQDKKNGCQKKFPSTYSFPIANKLFHRC